MSGQVDAAFAQPAAGPVPDHGLVVLDDDPTGTQAVAGVPVIVDTSPGFLADWFARQPERAVYVSTNTRALRPEEARLLVSEVAGIAAKCWPRSQIICRGDSTLRGHVLEEYQGLARGEVPVLLLVPAMPLAGRVTADGRHYLMNGDRRIPVADTEYARDPDFGYRSSAVLAWAEERSGGFFPASGGEVLNLARLRSGGAQAVAASLARLAGAGRPAAMVCDAESEADLTSIAEGIRLTWRNRTPVVVRTAPPLAAMLAGAAARAWCPAPAGARLLVVVGSYVRTTTDQIEVFARRRPGRIVVADLAPLLRDPERETRRLAAALDDCWRYGPVAALVTPRERIAVPAPGGGLAIATLLAQVIGKLASRPDVVLVRGGVTAAVVARAGLGAGAAWAAGPVRPGVALWRLDESAGNARLLVAAGNVGRPADLADLADDIVAERTGGDGRGTEA